MKQAAALTANLPVERAGVLMLLGREDEALSVLSTAVDNGYRNLFWMRSSSDLHSLQNDPRFVALAARIE